MLSITLTILVVLLFFLCWLVARDYRRAVAVEKAETTQSSLSVERQKGPLGRAEVSDIASWMTFDYINYLFNMPASYLRKNLSFADPLYPHLSLSTYARHSGQQRQAVTLAVENAVTAFITGSSTPLQTSHQ